MITIQEQKKNIRKYIRETKLKYSRLDLNRLSVEVMSRLESHPEFRKSKRILIYNNMPDEVATTGLVNRWKDKKDFYLPVVLDNELVFRKYEDEGSLKESAYGIFEPTGDDFHEYDSVDLIIIPGVAFDRDRHRLGRGKGYYDRFLAKMPKTVKIGVCFSFQILESVPLSTDDVDMDCVISDVEVV